MKNKRYYKRAYCSIECQKADPLHITRVAKTMEHYYPFASTTKYNRYPKRRMFV